MKIKIFIIIAIIITVIFSIFFYIKINPSIKNLRDKKNDDIINKQCIGVIENIDDGQATIYYEVKGQRYSFSSVGRYEIYYYASIGDSIVKKAESSKITIFKPNGDYKEFLIE